MAKHKRVNSDLKLLRDIAPYINAYGHGMSHYEHGYTYFLAMYNISGDKNALAIAEFNERVLRSFMVTKNLTYSHKLIAKELGPLEDLPAPKVQVPYDQIKEEFKKIKPSILSNERERAKISKKKIDIAFERYDHAWREKYPEFVEAIRKVYEGADKMLAYIEYGSNMTLCAIIHKGGKDKFIFSMWRCDKDRESMGEGWLVDLSDGLSTWPEIGDAKWESPE